MIKLYFDSEIQSQAELNNNFQIGRHGNRDNEPPGSPIPWCPGLPEVEEAKKRLAGMKGQKFSDL
jgi:hypothetical protein